MKTAFVADMKAHFSDYLKESEKGPIVVTRNGKPVAVLLAASGDEELERLLMGHSPELNEILQAARRRFRAGQGIPHDRFWQEIEQENAAQDAQKTPGKKRRKANVLA